MGQILHIDDEDAVKTACLFCPAYEFHKEIDIHHGHTCLLLTCKGTNRIANARTHDFRIGPACINEIIGLRRIGAL